MTKDKADYTGQLNAKKLGGTGITEGLLRRHHNDEAGTLVIVASISVAGTHKNVKEGTGSVNYVIDDLEVAPSIATDHVRELIRSFEYERKLETEGKTLFDDRTDEPNVATVVEQGAQLRPHPFLPVDAADDDGICDVCGQLQAAAVHADRSALTDPFAAATGDDEDADQDAGPATPDDPAYDSHPYVEGPDGSCGFHDCDQDESAAVHDAA
jgi:hypothetical protein